MPGYLNLEAIGHLAKDPELKTSGSGTSYLQMRLGCTVRHKNEKETRWVSATVFGKRAEALAKLGLGKGDRIMVTGPCEVRTYQAQNGEHRADLSMIANEVVLLGGKRNNEAKPAAGDDAANYSDDEEIPF